MSLRIGGVGLLLGAMIFATSGLTISRAGEVARKRFEREYPAASERTERIFARIQGNCRRRLLVGGKESATNTVAGRFAREGERLKVEFFHAEKAAKPSEPGANIFCASGDTVFHIIRLPGETRYRLESIGSSDVDKYLFDNAFGGFFGVSFQLRGIPLRRLIGERDFEPIDVEEISPEGKSLVSVRFKTAYASGNPDLKEEVSLTLDPALNWAIREVEIHPVKDPIVKITYQAEYGEFRDGVPLPKLVRYQCAPTQTNIMEFDRFSFDTTAVDEFTLARYGLIEVRSDEAQSPRDWTLGRLAVLGIIGMVVAFVLKRRADRTRMSLSA